MDVEVGASVQLSSGACAAFWRGESPLRPVLQLVNVTNQQLLDFPDRSDLTLGTHFIYQDREYYSFTIGLLYDGLSTVMTELAVTLDPSNTNHYVFRILPPNIAGSVFDKRDFSSGNVLRLTAYEVVETVDSFPFVRILQYEVVERSRSVSDVLSLTRSLRETSPQDTAWAAAATSTQSADVLVSLPKPDGHGCFLLWSYSAFLRTKSSYLATLLQSGFGETSDWTEPIDAKPADGYDSDDELDLIYARRETGVTDWRKLRSSATKFAHIHVNQTRYATYRAVLVWMITKTIAFKKLAVFKTGLDNDTDEILPCSPKSVYRLADLLDIEELKEIALLEYQVQLVPSIVEDELQSDFCRLYDKPRRIIVDYLIMNGAAVQAARKD